jgi:hypothetical protein
MFERVEISAHQSVGRFIERWVESLRDRRGNRKQTAVLQLRHTLAGARSQSPWRAAMLPSVSRLSATRKSAAPNKRPDRHSLLGERSAFGQLRGVAAEERQVVGALGIVGCVGA